MRESYVLKSINDDKLDQCVSIDYFDCPYSSLLISLKADAQKPVAKNLLDIILPFYNHILKSIPFLYLNEGIDESFFSEVYKKIGKIGLIIDSEPERVAVIVAKNKLITLLNAKDYINRHIFYLAQPTKFNDIILESLVADNQKLWYDNNGDTQTFISFSDDEIKKESLNRISETNIGHQIEEILKDYNIIKMLS